MEIVLKPTGTPSSDICKNGNVKNLYRSEAESSLKCCGVDRMPVLLELLGSQLANTRVQLGYFVEEMWIQAGGGEAAQHRAGHDQLDTLLVTNIPFFQYLVQEKS